MQTLSPLYFFTYKLPTHHLQESGSNQPGSRSRDLETCRDTPSSSRDLERRGARGLRWVGDDCSDGLRGRAVGERGDVREGWDVAAGGRADCGDGVDGYGGSGGGCVWAVWHGLGARGDGDCLGGVVG
jgi:hypothetical protein